MCVNEQMPDQLIRPNGLQLEILVARCQPYNNFVHG